MNLSPSKVLVAMSGGINSSTTAVLLKTQGYDVQGVFFQIKGPALGKFESRCCMTMEQEGKGRLKAICQEIGIPLHVISVEQLFEDQVVDYVVHESLQNHVPNPCIRCNSEVKFKYLIEKADALGCQWIATGHYAQISIDSGTGVARLMKAADPQRDETYYLFELNQAVLKRLLLPLGSLTGHMVDKISEKFNFKHPHKVNQHPICCINEPGFKAFMESRTPPAMRVHGMVRNMDGMILGEHLGLFQYRLGQPSIIPNPEQEKNPLYIVGFDLTAQSLVIGHESLFIYKEMTVHQVSWVRRIDQLHGFRCMAKLGPWENPFPCVVTCYENKRVHVEFEQDLRAISKGIAVVFYLEDEILGGGYVEIFGTKESIESE